MVTHKDHIIPSSINIPGLIQFLTAMEHIGGITSHSSVTCACLMEQQLTTTLTTTPHINKTSQETKKPLLIGRERPFPANKYTH